jgi:opacity protein-like surface antigen
MKRPCRLEGLCFCGNTHARRGAAVAHRWFGVAFPAHCGFASAVGGVALRRFFALAAVGAAFLPDSSLALELPAPADAQGWFVQTRLIAGISSAPGAFLALPPGATDSEQTSYQPQEYYGAGVGLGYGFSAWGVPFRAVLDGSLNFRHDTDVEAQAVGSTEYKGNLQTAELRLSLLADIIDFGWGRFYAGGGIGAARVRTEVEIEHTPTSVVSVEWKASPSFEAGIAFTSFSRRVIPHVAYRFRWIGEVESGTFADGEKLRFSDFNVHDLMFGFTIPLAEDGSRFAPVAFAGTEPLASTISPEENLWTGFHVGGFGALQCRKQLRP